MLERDLGVSFMAAGGAPGGGRNSEAASSGLDPPRSEEEAGFLGGWKKEPELAAAGGSNREDMPPPCARSSFGETGPILGDPIFREESSCHKGCKPVGFFAAFGPVNGGASNESKELAET